jgi:fido (protein-threonine AMPylation protein)
VASSSQIGVAGGDDLVRQYTEDEKRQLTEQLLALTEEVHRGAFSQRKLDLAFVCELHARLFNGVRDHAGRYRRRDFGSEYLIFGPNRSVRREDVESDLAQVFANLERSLDSFARNPEAEQYDASALHVAVWAHAQVIRVHPFEDGNGRTSRLVMNILLTRLGLRAVAVEVCKQEYYACLNKYFDSDDLQPLIDLVLRVYPA